MGAEFNSFDKSDLGVFVKSPLGVRGLFERIVWGMIIQPIFGNPDHEVQEVGQMNKKEDDIKKIGLNEGFNQGATTDGPIFALQEFKGNLYCCGDINFKGDGASPRKFSNIAKYNSGNGEWEVLTVSPPTFFDFDLNNLARKMIVFNGLLIILGGDNGFTRAGNSTDTNSNGLVGWDGTQFISVGATLALNPVDGINDVIEFNGFLTVCGLIVDFTTFDEAPIKFRKNDIWTIASPTELNIGEATTFVVFEDELYFALDTGTIRKWSGTGTFTTVATVTGEVRTMEVHEGKLTIGGSISLVAGVAVRGVAEFDGTDWAEIGTGLDFLGASEGAFQLLSAADFLWCVGQFDGNNDGDDFMGLTKIGPTGDWVKTWDDTDMDNNLTDGFSLATFKGKLDFTP